MEFKELCAFYQSVKTTKGSNEKSKLVENFLKKFKTPDTIFPVLRLLVPKLDRDRATYNMKESKIARIIIKMLDLPSGNDKNLLTKSYLLGGGCDFSEVVYTVLRKYISGNKSELTIHELSDGLDKLTKRKSEGETEEIMLKLFRKSSPEDSKWIIRLILKDLKLGIDSNKILKCFHPDASEFYSGNNNLRSLCEILSDRNVKIHELEIQVFQVFRPMLSKRIDARNFQKEFPNHKPFFIENKFDGERFQLHMNQNQFKYFSRNGFDYTKEYGGNYESGILTSKLRGVFHETINRIILDGEMMLWHKERKVFGSKGMTLDVKKINSTGRYAVCFCVYDILLVNDKVLTNEPLKVRLSKLREALVGCKQGVIIISEYVEITGQQAIVHALNESVDKGEEGIIIKDPNSIYKYSDRNSGWFKLKLEYFSDVMNDMDLVLMGGCYTSYTKTKLNTFLVGLCSGTNSEGLPMYYCFGKVSTGLTVEQVANLDERLKNFGHPYNNANFTEKSKNQLVFGKELPHYWIEPHKSLVLVVRVSELVRTTDNSFKTPYSFRFPRILSVRDDKPADECMSINELLELTQNNSAVVKVNKRSINLEEILSSKPQTRKKPKINILKMQSTGQVSEMLQGFTVLVLNDSSENAKEDLENIIRRAGGTVSYTINPQVDLVLVGTPNPEKIQQLSQPTQKYDIIDVAWLKRSIQAGEPLNYQHSDVYFLGCNYANILSNDLDLYADSFTEDSTRHSLEKSFGIIRNMKERTLQRVDIPSDNKRFHFENYTAYFDKHEVVNDTATEVVYRAFGDELQFRYYHGKVSGELTDDVNLVVLGRDDRRGVVQEFLDRSSRSDVQIVSREFLYM